jgi:ABC-type sugar transport system substrate-binding protein
VAVPRDKTIGYLQITTAAAGVRRLTEALQQATQQLGWKVVPCDAGGDPAKMNACAEKFIAQDVDAIMSTAIAPAQIATSLRDAKAKDIPWFDVGQKDPPSSDFAGAVFIDDAAVQKTLDDWWLKQVGDEDRHVLEWTIPQILAQVDGAKQFHADIQGKPNVDIVETKAVNLADPVRGTKQTTTDTLRQHPEIDTIMSPDLAQDGVAQAVQQAGKVGDITVLGHYPGLPELQLIRDGVITAASETPPEAAAWVGVDELAQMWARDKPLTKYGPPTGYSLDVFRPVLITKDNVQQDKDRYQDPSVDYVDYFKTKGQKEFDAK